MKKIFTILSVLLVSTHAMTAQTLTLGECRAKALEHNKQLQAAKVKEEKLQHDVKSYRANFFPRIDIYAGDAYTWGTTELAVPASGLASGVATSLGPTLVQSGIMTPQMLQGLGQQMASLPDLSLDFRLKNTFFATAALIQPLYMGGKITSAYKMAKIGQEMASSNVRLTEAEVIVNTDEAYMLAVKAKELADVARSYKALLDELQKNVDAAVNHGMKTRNDALKVQVKRNEVELNITKADNAYRLACMNLCQVIGMELNSQISVSAESFNASGDLNARALASVGIGARPEYDILNRKTQLAGKKVKLAQSDYLPQVLLMGGYSYLNGMELQGRKLFDSGSPSVGVAVKIPVLSYFTEGVHKIRSARAEHQMAQLEQEELNEKMTLELTQSANVLSEAVMEMQITARSKEQAAENMKMSKHQYEVGLEPLSDYLEAQALWQQACANEIEARYKWNLANTRYSKASGTIFSGQ